jgi:hypothetical protein
MWTPITKENIETLKPGESIKFHNGYEWDTNILDQFWIDRGFILTGLHNETANFLRPMFGRVVYVWRLI